MRTRNVFLPKMTTQRTVFLFLCILGILTVVFFSHNQQWIYPIRLLQAEPSILKMIPKSEIYSIEPRKTSLSSGLTFTQSYGKVATGKPLAMVSKLKAVTTYRTTKSTVYPEHTGSTAIKINHSCSTPQPDKRVTNLLDKKSSKHYFHLKHWDRLVQRVNCQALIRGENDEQKRTLSILKTDTLTSRPGNDYINLTQNCQRFKSSSGYITLPVNTIEENFPLAFSILMFKDIEQVERLLRAIYRPQNFYCIHVDIKTDQDIKTGMNAIAECFDNVYIVPDPSDVQWGKFSVIEPELKCMELLWSRKKWKYYINLTGQEFPLKTNLELVEILQAYNGANNVEGTRKRANVDRWQSVGPAPHGIIPSKGAVHVVVSREYVDYLLHSPVAQDFIEWVNSTIIPDETLFSTLNHNPHLGVPGSYMGTVLIPIGEPETSKTYPFLTRYKVWVSGMFSTGCNGKYVRSVCIFGIKDLPKLTSAPHLFANKFHWDFQHYTLDCLEEWHFNKTRNELTHPSTLNITFYKELSFVKLAVRPGNLTQV